MGKKKAEMMIGKLTVKKYAENLVSHLRNDYKKDYPLLGASFNIPSNYLNMMLDEGLDEKLYKAKGRVERIKILLELPDAYGDVITPDGSHYKCEDAYILYECASGLNQKNRSVAISQAKRPNDVYHFYDATNLLIVYKGSGGRSRKLKK